MKKDFSKIVVLVQAPADIPYALDIIQRHKSSDIHVYAINVENIYKLLKKVLETKIHLEFIPYPFVGYNSVNKIRRTKKEFYQLWKSRFETNDYNGAGVFFFSRFEDSFTCFLIEQFNRRKNVCINYINHYDPKGLKIRLKDTFRCLIFNPVLYYITGASFKITYWGKYPELNVNNYHIKEQVADIAHLDLTPYLFSVGKQPAVLYLVNPKYDGCCYDFDDYVQKIKSISDGLRSKGVTIYIKGHPRMGLPKELDGVYDERIEDFVISELIDYSKFRLVVGCESTAIAHAALQKTNGVVSILDMLKPANKENFERVRSHICNQSENKVLLVNNIEEILDVYESSSN